MDRLAGKTALVTGASRGIGRGIAVRLASEGASVFVHYGTSAMGAEQTVRRIEAAGGSAIAIGADLSTIDGIEGLAATLESELAGASLDIVVNNAGTGRPAALEDTPPDLFDAIFAVNARAPFFIIQRTLPLIPDGGRIVNIGSHAARIAGGHLAAYAMSKGAVEVLGRTLANALGSRGITVNTVAPGMTNTDLITNEMRRPGAPEAIERITALGRLGMPDDIAAAVAFLASDDGRWITGAVLEATGGMWLGPRLWLAD